MCHRKTFTRGFLGGHWLHPMIQDMPNIPPEWSLYWGEARNIGTNKGSKQGAAPKGRVPESSPLVGGTHQGHTFGLEVD
jgi:hypothetical protein